MKINDITLIHPVQHFRTLHLVESIYDFELIDTSDFISINKKGNLTEKFLIPLSNIAQVHCFEIKTIKKTDK